MPDYLVYHEAESEDDFSVGSARWVKSVDEADAAEQYMEVHHADLDYAPICMLAVRDKHGRVTRWKVEASLVLHTFATRLEES